MDKEPIKSNNDLDYKSELTLVGTPKITKIRFDKIQEYKDATNYHLSIKNKIVDKTETSCKIIQSIIIYSLEENRPFSAEFEAECPFEWSEGLSEKKKEMFINYNAPSNILAYIRPVLTQILIYSGLPDFRLPLVNMFDIVNNDKAKTL